MKSIAPFKTVTRILKVATFAVVLLAQTSLYAAEPPAMTEDQKTLYAIGLSVARSLSVFTLTPSEFETVMSGISDSYSAKKPVVDIQAYTGKIQELAKARRKASGEKQASAGKEFLEKSAKEKGAVKTPSGIVYLSIAEGKGESPKANDIVKVNYRGTLIDGKEFDSSYKHGRPLEFKLSNVITCWVEGIQMMKPGGKAKLVCPPEMAYGESGAGDTILPQSTLAFEVELLEAKSADAPIGSVPAMPAAPVK